GAAERVAEHCGELMKGNGRLADCEQGHLRRQNAHPVSQGPVFGVGFECRMNLAMTEQQGTGLRCEQDGLAHSPKFGSLDNFCTVACHEKNSIWLEKEIARTVIRIQCSELSPVRNRESDRRIVGS